MEEGARVDYYDGTRYWNELPAVIRHLSKRCSGSESEWWNQYLRRRYLPVPAAHALVIGCGNGWVERCLVDDGLALAVDAFDVDPANIAAAEGARDGRPIDYEVADFATFRPKRRYDLIVNVAALHHAERLYRICDVLAAALEPNGLFFHWEYVGPNRNQYGEAHLDVLTTTLEAMPERFRTPHPLRPSLGLMVQLDRTEAVHAREIRRAVEDRFDVVEFRALGGGIAYPLLWNNVAPFETDDEEAQQWLHWLLEQDERATTLGIVPTLFACLIATARTTPRRRFAPAVDRWVREPVRERFATVTGGVYADELARSVRRHRTIDLRTVATQAAFHARQVIARRGRG